MNIWEAVERIRINGGGKVYRETAEPVEIAPWSDETWEDFLKCRATLNIDDLAAIDWKYSKEAKDGKSESM